MSSIFGCCFSRKNKPEVNDAEVKGEPDNVKGSSSSSSKAGSQELVATTGNDNANFVDSTEDLGDFSGVQREHELLSSYRRPQAPRKKEKHKRAPKSMAMSRALTQSQEDMFGLAEESFDSRDSSDTKPSATSRPPSTDAVDQASLPQAASRESLALAKEDVSASRVSAARPTSDVSVTSAADRVLSNAAMDSSMLMDIDMTLQALKNGDDDGGDEVKKDSREAVDRKSDIIEEEEVVVVASADQKESVNVGVAKRASKVISEKGDVEDKRESKVQSVSEDNNRKSDSNQEDIGATVEPDSQHEEDNSVSKRKSNGEHEDAAKSLNENKENESPHPPQISLPKQENVQLREQTPIDEPAVSDSPIVSEVMNRSSDVSLEQSASSIQSPSKIKVPPKVSPKPSRIAKAKTNFERGSSVESTQSTGEASEPTNGQRDFNTDAAKSNPNKTSMLPKSSLKERSSSTTSKIPPPLSSQSKPQTGIPTKAGPVSPTGISVRKDSNPSSIPSFNRSTSIPSKTTTTDSKPNNNGVEQSKFGFAKPVLRSISKTSNSSSEKQDSSDNNGEATKLPSVTQLRNSLQNSADVMAKSTDSITNGSDDVFRKGTPALGDVDDSMRRSVDLKAHINFFKEKENKEAEDDKGKGSKIPVFRASSNKSSSSHSTSQGEEGTD